MIYLISILSFIGVSLAVTLAYSYLSTALYGDVRRLRRRVEEEFAKNDETVNSVVFKNFEAGTFTRTGTLEGSLDGDFAPAMEPRKPSLTIRLKTLLDKSDLNWSLQQLLTVSAACGFVLAVAGLFLTSSPLGVAFGLPGLVGPGLFVRHRAKRRRDLYLSQLPAAFDLMARVIRSGQSVTQSLQSVGDTFEPPISIEFANCQKQQMLGLAPETTYKQMAERSDILEMRIFVIAMAIQRQTGGNLSEVLERLAHLMRERQKLRKRVRTLTAEGRLQGITLFILPFVVFGAMMVLNRSYAEGLFQHSSLLIATGVAMLGGLVWIRKIVNFEY